MTPGDATYNPLPVAATVYEWLPTGVKRASISRFKTRQTRIVLVSSSHIFRGGY